MFQTDALEAAIIGGCMAEGIVAGTEFLFSPKTGCSKDVLDWFDSTYPVRKDGNGIDYCLIYSLEGKRWPAMAVRRLLDTTSNVNLFSPYVSTDDAERTLGNLKILAENNAFRGFGYEQFKRFFWKEMHDWSQNSVYVGTTTRLAYQEPDSFEDYLRVMEDPSFRSHTALTLGPMMQAGPFCVCEDPAYVLAMGELSNPHPVAQQSLYSQWMINRELLLLRKSVCSSQRIGVDRIRAVIDGVLEKIVDPHVRLSITDAIEGKDSILHEGHFVVEHDGKSHHVIPMTLHAIYSLVYVLLRAESYIHGIGIGLRLSRQTENFDTDTNAQIQGFSLGLVFGKSAVVAELGSENVRAWESFDPTSEDHGMGELIDKIKNPEGPDHVQLSRDVIISPGDLEKVRSGEYTLVPFIREDKKWTQCSYRESIHKLF